MLAAAQHQQIGPRRPSTSRRCTHRRHCPRRQNPRQAKWAARPKTAPGVFWPRPLVTRPARRTQTLGSHQESWVFGYDFASGCAVAPNSGGGFAQSTDQSCVATAVRQVVYSVTGVDPGDVATMAMVAAVTGTQAGYGVPLGSMSAVANALDNLGVPSTATSYASTIQLASSIGTTPSIVTETANGMFHAVTVAYDPSSYSFVVTNPSGVPGVGGSESVSIIQLLGGGIPVTNTPVPYAPPPGLPPSAALVPGVAVISPNP